MSGLKLVLPTTFTDNTLPILRNDPVLSSGSLLLVDPAHGYSPWAAGVPANLATVPNLAGDIAAGLIGTTQALTAPIFDYSSPFLSNEGALDRSSKGGLNLISSVTPQPANQTRGASFTFPDALKNYLLSRLDDDYFISMWQRVTRAGGVATSEPQPLFYSVGNTSSASNNYLALADTTQSKPGPGAQLLGKRETSMNTVGPMIRNIGTALFSGTKPTTTATMRGRFAVIGEPQDTSNSALVVNWSPSYVFYRFYMENLTVSGRSYAEVDALDNAEFTKHVLTAGGRYYGDTFTNPSTVP